MKRIGSVVLALSALLSVGCGASINASVQVFRGTTSSIHTTASSSDDLLKAQASANSARKGLDGSMTEVSTSATKLKGEANAASESVKAITREKEFKPFREAWAKYIAAVVKELSKTGTTPESLNKAVQAERAAVRAQVTSKPSKSSDTTLRLLYTSALREALEPSEKDTLNTLDVLLCWDDGACVAKLTEAQRALLAEKSVSTTLKDLQGKVSAVEPPSTWTLPRKDDATKAIDEILASFKAASRDFNEARWDNAATSIKDAIDANTKASTKPDGNDKNKPANDKVAIARVALNSLADDIAGVKLEVDELEQLGSIEQFFAQPEVASLSADARPSVAALKQAIDAALEEKHKAPAQIRAAADLGSAADDSLTDPNLKKLGVDSDDDWSAPIDKLYVHASGDSDFVIVQESPTHFSVKQLRFDPAKNAQLTMSIADLGLDIATLVLQQTTGVSLGLGKENQVTGDAGRRVADDCRASLRTMSANLGKELEGLPNDARPVDAATLGRVRGMLAAQRALVKACTRALGTVEPTGTKAP